MFSAPLSLAIAITGTFLTLMPYLFFWAEPGYQYFLVYPTGQADVVVTQDVKFRGFAKVISWQKYIDVKVVEEDD